AVPHNVPIMLLKGPAKKVPTFRVCDKVEILRGRGIERGAKSRFARIRNRTGGQPLISVRIVSRRELEIGAPQLAAISPGECERVYNSRVALQRLADTQPVFKHTGNMRAFLGPRRFALYQRS